MYLNIPTEEDNTASFFNPEAQYNDIIFNGKETYSGYDAGSIMSDKDYQKPDRVQYIFSNMQGVLNTIYNNNIVLPIRNKYRNTPQFHLSSELAKYTDNKKISSGVFIIDYYTIFNDGFNNIENIISYYLNGNTLEFPSHVINSIASIFNKTAKLRQSEYKIRIITYIPETIINELSYVYVPTADVVIAKGEISNRVVHPFSKTYRTDNSHLMNENKNILIIDIVDNDKSKPYFIKIGNTVQRIYPTKNTNRKNGGTVSLKINGTNINTTECKLDELGGICGIYPTKEEADSEGNINKLLELNKLKLSMKELDLGYEKLKTEKIVLEQKLEMGQLDIAKKYIEQDLLYRKAAIEIKTSILKNNMDINSTKLKHRLEMRKINTDYAVKLVTGIVTIFKLIK